jgi:nitrogen fixation protein NifX
VADNTIRVAVASWDGEHITQHFGHAEQFIIYEIESNSYKCIETRSNQAGCKGRTHDGDLLAQSAELLADCEVVLVSRIGQGARALLAERGILAMEAPIFIDDALERLIASKYFKNLTHKENKHGEKN